MTEQPGDQWATLDELLGLEALDRAKTDDGGIGRLAFYGRCSTEDNQDPRTSLAWQLGEAQRFVEPLGGAVVAQYFDIGQSRSLPWERREQASEVLRALKDPGRGWDGLVVGEATRCWYGNQFSLTWPKFDRYGVSLWIPSLGGRFEPDNTVHDMAMTITGGLSKSERQHVQRRVRAAMAAQVLIDGKHQGGRAPYGYKVADAGPHPNPRKAQEGYRLRVLALDETASPVVERIFAMYLDGTGIKSIAEQLNLDGIPCPSAHTPRQNRHRRQDGWQHSSVKAILNNPRYTGYAIYGRWQKVEELLDPEDVAAGYVVRFRRSPQAKVVRSREPAHPAIVSVQTFTEVQLQQRSRSAGGREAWSSVDRDRRSPNRTYLLRGLLRCGICGRKMEGAHRHVATYYRCNARTLVPGTLMAMNHPPQIYLREDLVTPRINDWIATLFDRTHRKETLELLYKADDTAEQELRAQQALRRRIVTADATMTRLRTALEAGWDPAELRDQYNAAVADKRAAELTLKVELRSPTLSRQQLAAVVDSLGDMAKALARAEPKHMAELYASLRLSMTYHHMERVVDVEVDPVGDRVDKLRVRGGT